MINLKYAKFNNVNGAGLFMDNKAIWGRITFGTILLIIGLGMIFFGQPSTYDYETDALKIIMGFVLITVGLTEICIGIVKGVMKLYQQSHQRYKYPQRTQVIFCNNCKKQVRSDLSYCPYCSQSLISNSYEITNHVINKVE